jgi:glycosyltransferase involved in cell wall biosynthesis
MKVLHVIPGVGPLRGGPSTAIRGITQGLAERGVAVDVATTDDEVGGSVPLGHPVVDGKVTYWYFRRQTRFYSVSWPLAAWLRKNIRSYDLVHIHGLFTFASTAASWCAVRSGVPYLVRPYGTLSCWGVRNRRPRLKKLSIRLLERNIVGRAVATHFTSEQEQQEARLFIPSGRGVIVPNPVGWEAGPKRSSADQTRRILFLGRLDPKKGIDLLLPAFAQVRRQFANVTLVIAGSGQESFVAGLRERARALGIAEHVSWPGFLQGAAKQAAFDDADLFVLPSYSENFGIAAVEAMMSGTPLIVTDQVAIHGDITSAGAGLVVSCDPDELAKAILLLLADETLRRRLAQRAIELAKEFSIDAVTDRMLATYLDIVAPTEPLKSLRVR